MRNVGWIQQNININPKTLAGLCFQAGEDVHYNPYPKDDERHRQFGDEMRRLYAESENVPLGMV